MLPSAYSVDLDNGNGPLHKQGTMGDFPAYALLEIFSFYMDMAQRADEWYVLVHVCQRWRHVVLGSTRRLNLRLLCTPKSPVRKMLDIWPPLPLVISNPDYTKEYCWERLIGASDVIAALGHKDRIVEISLFDVPWRGLEELLPAMREPLPALTKLRLCSDFILKPNFRTDYPLPASFLGGSAPLLQVLHLSRFPYPAFSKLLLSARNLVHLEVLNLPDTWHITSKNMATCLSSLTKLTTFVLGFVSESHIRPLQVSKRPSEQKRIVLHSLTCFHYSRGTPEYLEDLVARIDAPRLRNVVARFARPIVSADISELSQFIGRADNFWLLNRAEIFIDSTGTLVSLRLNVAGALGVWYELIFPGWDGDGPPSALAKVCVNSTRSSPSSLPLSTLEHLTICGYRYSLPWWRKRWLEFLFAFTAVKNLYLCGVVAPRHLPVLKDVTGEDTTEVLPALRNLFLDNLYLVPPVKI